MTISRENFRRIMGLDDDEFEPYTANDRPPLYGGYEAVYFGDWNNSNTSNKDFEDKEDEPTTHCPPDDLDCIIDDLEPGSDLPEIEIYDCETGEKTIIYTNISKATIPKKCTEPPTPEHKCAYVLQRGCSGCGINIKTCEFLTFSEAQARFEELLINYMPCPYKKCVPNWKHNKWILYPTGDYMRQDLYNCSNGAPCTGALAYINSAHSCNCRQDKNIQATATGFQYTCYDTAEDRRTFECVSGCITYHGEEVEVEVCSTAYGISVRRKSNGDWLFGTDNYGRKL